MGQRTARTYTSEFKQQAAGLANRIGTHRAAEQLGVPVTTLYQWKGKEEKGKPQYKKEEVNLEAENRQLRKENEELKKVNYILKKAAAFFSQDHLK
jgi:transposase